MTAQRQREIVVEFEKIRTIRKRAKTHLHFCGGCGAEADFISAGRAAELFEIDTGDLLQFVKRHKSHLQMETADDPDICLVSLLKNIRELTNTQQKMLTGDRT